MTCFSVSRTSLWSATVKPDFFIWDRIFSVGPGQDATRIYKWECFCGSLSLRVASMLIKIFLNDREFDLPFFELFSTDRRDGIMAKLSAEAWR